MYQQFILFSATLLTFMVLYLPQPLQPLLAALYQRPIATGGALTTVTLIPLAIAPLAYGYMIGNIHPLRLLRVGLVLLAASCVAFALVQGFNYLLLIRFIQGLLIPAMITAILSLLVTETKRLQTTLSVYITVTIFGGFLGRLLSAGFASFWDWTIFSYLMAFACILTAIFLPRAKIADSMTYQRPHWRDFYRILQQRPVLLYYLLIFGVFFSFVALLNYLPFILQRTFPEAGTWVTGLMYSGYISGAVTALLAERIARRWGLYRSLRNALMVFVGAIATLFLGNIYLTFIVLFAFCAAMFFIHTTAIASINHHSHYSKALTNAFYTCFYYSGAVLGSYLPGLVYQYYGEYAFLSLLLMIGACVFILIHYLAAENKTSA